MEQKSTCVTAPTANTNMESTSSNEQNPGPADVAKLPSANEKSVLQLMNELAKFNKV